MKIKNRLVNAFARAMARKVDAEMTHQDAPVYTQTTTTVTIGDTHSRGAVVQYDAWDVYSVAVYSKRGKVCGVEIVTIAGDELDHA